LIFLRRHSSQARVTRRRFCIGSDGASAPPDSCSDSLAAGDHAACQEYHQLVNDWSTDYGAELGAVGQAVQPRVAARMASGRPVSARGLYQESTAWIVALTWPVYLAVAACADWYLRLFGGEYATAEARAVIWILVPAMLIASACGVVDSVLAMAGKTSWQLYDVSAALAVNVVLNLLLVPQLGVVGAAIAWSAAVLVNNLIPLAQLWGTFGLHPFGALTLRTLVAAAAGFGLLPWTAGLFGEAWAFAALAAAGLAWGAVLLRYRRRI
jgi:O-antigen/teichoic acid export membrane protein